MEIRIFSTGKMFGKDKNMPEYKCSWPKDNLYVDGYVHQVTNFRYHALAFIACNLKEKVKINCLHDIITTTILGMRN